MATVQKRNDSYRILFCYQDRRHTFTLGAVSRDEAENKARQVEYLLMRLKQGLKHLPVGVDIVTFVQQDGESHEPSQPAKSAATGALEGVVSGLPVTLASLRDSYQATHGNGTIEPSTLAMRRVHFGHLVRFFGEEFPPAETTVPKLQEYVNRRAEAGVVAATIRLEVASFRAVWNWGVSMSLTAGLFPGNGLRYPKGDEKPPFMTKAEIERRLASGGTEELWECLYLTPNETDQLLEHVHKHASHPWLYPLFVFAAHTGARRSEILRVQLADVDFSDGVVTIREKKRGGPRRTSRRVPLTPLLRRVLEDWLLAHPGGPFLFCHPAVVKRSKKRSPTTGYAGHKTRAKSARGRKASVRRRAEPDAAALTRNEVHDHFKRALRESEWQGIRGLHCLRHSFISACASKAIDQRLIDEWTGHSTEEQRRRYLHLFPSTQRAAIASVFDTE